jgi:Ribonuclease G/E
VRATLCIDNAVGEHRRALLDEAGRPFRLELERWSERGKRAKLDEVWWGRAHARMPGMRGWFIDLGLERDGVLETGATITEGMLLPVRVKSEAWADKGPVLSLADMPRKTPRPDKPARHAEPPDDPFFAGVEITATLTGEEARREIDAAIDEATTPSASIPGGGELLLDFPRALTVIDVDAGAREGSEEGDFDLLLNLAAADQAARQLALRGLGGLVVVDFVTLRRRQEREAVAERFRECLTRRLGRASHVLEISSLGLCEASIARRMRPTPDVLAAAPAAEREALDALRGIESEALNRQPWIHAKVSRVAEAWLTSDPIGWEKALADRIGPRWRIEAEDRPPGRPQVWSSS